MKKLNTDFILREPRLKDAEDLLNITNDDEVMKYYGESGSYHKTLKEAEEEIQWFLNLVHENGRRWIIADKQSDRYMGDIGIFNGEADHRRAEIGFKLARPYWRQGIMGQAVQFALQFGFNDLNYNRIEALVDPLNPGSQKTLLKNGFTLEGTLRDYEFEHGHFVDLQIYSLLKREFC